MGGQCHTVAAAPAGGTRATGTRATGTTTGIDDGDASLLDAIPDAIVGIDASGVVTIANSRAAALFAAERDDLIGRPFADLVPDDAAPPADGSSIARGRDGREFSVDISTSDATVDGRDVTLAVIRDVSARRRAELLARGILDGAPDAIIGVTEDGTIALANAEAERLLGFGRGELVGRPVELLVPAAARARHAEHRQHFLGHPGTRPMGIGLELTARCADGSEVPVEISLSAIDAPDGLLVLAAVRDVRERIEARKERDELRRQAERERRESRAQRVERLESLGQLAGGVAHDFNNLLAVITNYTSFVDEEVRRAATEDNDRWSQAIDDLQQVLRASGRAGELTRQLLAFGRREVAQPRVVDLSALVDDAEPLLRRALGEHVDLRLATASEPWNTKLDPAQLEQVMVNLATNAREAMPTGGVLTVRTVNVPAGSDVLARSLVEGDAVALVMHDTGRGVAPEVAARAFEPFFTTKARGEGSGLGLATVYGIVTQAGGDVMLDSTAGEGTTVTVLLPRTTEARTDQADEGGARASQPSTILLVEDEPAMREVARRMLERLGHIVLSAGGGDEAIAYADAHDGPIDLLLTDVVMPKMLGKTVAEEVAARRPGVPVLFMSGYAHPVLASQGRLDEGVHLLAKPFSAEQLDAKVREVLDD